MNGVGRTSQRRGSYVERPAKEQDRPLTNSAFVAQSQSFEGVWRSRAIGITVGSVEEVRSNDIDRGSINKTRRGTRTIKVGQNQHYA